MVNSDRRIAILKVKKTGDIVSKVILQVYFIRISFSHLRRIRDKAVKTKLFLFNWLMRK